MSDQSDYPVAVPENRTYSQSNSPPNKIDRPISNRHTAALVKEKSPCTECQRARKGVSGIILDRNASPSINSYLAVQIAFQLYTWAHSRGGTL